MKKNYSSSSIFSLKGNDLDERANRRNRLYEEALLNVKENLNEVVAVTSDSDVVTRDSLKEWILQQLISDYREREGY